MYIYIYIYIPIRINCFAPTRHMRVVNSAFHHFPFRCARDARGGACRAARGMRQVYIYIYIYVYVCM